MGWEGTAPWLIQQALKGQSLCTAVGPEKTVEEAGPWEMGTGEGALGGSPVREHGQGPLSFMSLCLALSEDDEDGGFSSWNVYPVPGPMLSTLCVFSHLSHQVDAIMIPLFLQRRKLSCREVRPLSQHHAAS